MDTDDPTCQVCGEGLSLRPVVSCSLCETPHHRECWGYLGGCATFGCGAQTARAGRPGPGSTVEILDEMVEVVRAPTLRVAVERSRADRKAALVPAAGRTVGFGAIAFAILVGPYLLLRLLGVPVPPLLWAGLVLYGLVQSLIVSHLLGGAAAATGELTLDRDDGVVSGRFGNHVLMALLQPGTRVFVTRTPDGQLTIDLRDVHLGSASMRPSGRSAGATPFHLRILPPVPEHSPAAAALLTFASAVARHVGTPLEHRSVQPSREGQSTPRHLPAPAHSRPRLVPRDEGADAGED